MDLVQSSRDVPLVSIRSSSDPLLDSSMYALFPAAVSEDHLGAPFVPVSTMLPATTRTTFKLQKVSDRIHTSQWMEEERSVVGQLRIGWVSCGCLVGPFGAAARSGQHKLPTTKGKALQFCKTVNRAKEKEHPVLGQFQVCLERRWH